LGFCTKPFPCDTFFCCTRGMAPPSFFFSHPFFLKDSLSPCFRMTLVRFSRALNSSFLDCRACCLFVFRLRSLFFRFVSPYFLDKSGASFLSPHFFFGRNTPPPTSSPLSLARESSFFPQPILPLLPRYCVPLSSFYPPLATLDVLSPHPITNVRSFFFFPWGNSTCIVNFPAGLNFPAHILSQLSLTGGGTPLLSFRFPVPL